MSNETTEVNGELPVTTEPDYAGTLAAELAAEIQGNTATDDNVATAEAPEQAAPESQPPVTEAVTEEPRSQQILALAKREKALRAREAKLEADIEQRVADAVAAKMAELRDVALSKPSKFFRDELGVEEGKLGQVATDLWYTQLGDEAPAEYKQKREADSVRDEIAALRREQAEWRAEQAKAKQMERVSSYIGELRGFANAVPEGMPFLAAEYAADPETTIDALCQAAADMTTNGNPPPVAVVAAALEAEIEKLAERYANAKKAKTPPPTPSSNRPTTLTNTQTTGARHTTGWDADRAYAEVEEMIRADFRKRSEA